MGRNNKHKRGARNKRGPVRSERRPSLTGRVQLHEHSAYVVTENGDYKVMGRGKREIMDGDTVAVSIKNSPHGERRAVIAVSYTHLDVYKRQRPKRACSCARRTRRWPPSPCRTTSVCMTRSPA